MKDDIFLVDTILLRKYNLELHMTATELTESTERGVWSGKSISVFSVAESYKKQIRFSIIYLQRTSGNLEKFHG